MKNINKKFFNRKEIPIENFHKGPGKTILENGEMLVSLDFITSPDISFLFGEVIAIWVISYWEYLKKPKNS